MSWASRCSAAAGWSRAIRTRTRAAYRNSTACMSAVPILARRDDGAVWLDRLKRAALADEAGAALDGVLKTVATL